MLNGGKVGDIITLQVKIIKQIKILSEFVNQTKELTGDEREYCIAILNNLPVQCIFKLDHLLQITTIMADDDFESEGYLMKDDGRIKRIELVFGSMQDMYRFISQFQTEIKIIVIQRTQERKDIVASQNLYK